MLWQLTCLYLVVAASGCASGAAEGVAGQDVAVIYGVPVFSDLAGQVSYNDLIRSGADDVARCMAEEGFEFHEPLPLLDGSSRSAEEMLDMSDEHYAATYGYGQAPFRLEHLFRATDEEGEQMLAEQVSGLDDYYTTLSEAEREAYDRSYLGNGAADSGCQALMTLPLMETTGEYILAIKEIDATQLNVSLDVRVVEYYAGWARCMKDAGHGYTSPLAAKLDLARKADAASKDMDRAWMSELAEEEIEIASDTVRCGAETRDILDVGLYDIWDEYADAAGL